MNAFLAGWVWRMAFRDGRRNLGKLLLSMSCVVIGVASVIAVMSFRDNLALSMRAQSKTLLGADLSLESRQPFSPEVEALIKSLGGDQSRQIRFTSMAYFPDRQATRLVQVRALGRKFPYYGELETEPATAVGEFQLGPHALVDETVMLQFNLRAGDRVRIGAQDFRIAGTLRKIPGESLAFSLINPRVFIPLSFFEPSGLLQKGSLVRYRVFFKLDPRVDVDQLVQTIAPQLQQLRVEADTVKRRASAIARSLNNLTRYLGLASFVAMLLAGVGVASGVHVYAREKIASVAVLRCIGASPSGTVAVYAIQTMFIGAAGSVLGAVLGVSSQALLPIALKDFLPIRTITPVAPMGILLGIAVGFGTSLFFALLPLLPLRRLSPLAALRSGYEESPAAKDPFLYLLLLLIIGATFGFAVIVAERWFHALWFTAGVWAAFGFIAWVARRSAAMLKTFVGDFIPFAWRQGLANLHRPNNQTTAVMLSIGVVTFLLVTLYNVQSMLLAQVAERGGEGEPNLVLFDVQRDQATELAALLRSQGLQTYDQVPIVTMRLTAIKGRPLTDIRNDPSVVIPAWALRREYRSTYRDRLTATEQIIKGTWHGGARADTVPIPVSLEKGIAETLHVDLNDRLEFDLQGVPLLTRVASIREVDWQRVRPNFFVVFPSGVLEQAPQFFALVSRTDSAEISANLQRAVVQRYPNVSMIDLTLILNALDAILSKAAVAIRILALFTIFTAVAILASAILSRRHQRLKESILLKTLGAPRRQIVGIILAEYLFLGGLASATGALLSAFAGWGLNFYFFGTIARFDFMAVIWILPLATGTTIIFGTLGCWNIFRVPALEALRAETY